MIARPLRKPPMILPRRLLPAFLSVVTLLTAGCPGLGMQESAPPAFTAADLETVLTEVRTAVGWGAGGDVRLAGTARHRGVDDEFELLCTLRGEFVRTLTGRFAGAVGWDGTTAWSRDRSGLTHALGMQDLDGTLLEYWVYTGYWLDPACPLELALIATDDDAVRLTVRPPGAPMEGVLEIDRESWLPEVLTRSTDAGEYVWNFSDWKAVGGRKIAHTWLAVDSGGLADTYTVREAGPAPTFVRNPFGFHAQAAGDVRFDAEQRGEIEVLRAERTGHLLVHPFVDDEDVGWFIFDTGAGAMCIDKVVAEKLGMEAFGEETAVGVAGHTTTQFRQGETFSLGPVTMEAPIYIELDLSFLKPFLGVDVAGICGYDFLARTVVEMVPARGTIAVHDPATYELTGAEWRLLRIDENQPVVEASFEGDHTGPFKLDTGAGSTVTFHAPAVERLGLLEGRDVRESRAMGVGGAGRIYSGTIEWFELGGHRFENPPAGFSRAKTGAFRDEYTLGNIGQRFLAPFRLVFDYPHRRIAFVRVEKGR